MILYTVYDAITEKYFGRFFHFENDNHAKRVFQRTLMTDEVMQNSPEDYTLFRVGTYDDDVGIPQGHEPVRIWTGLDALHDLQRRSTQVQELQAEIAKLTNPEQNDEIHDDEPTEH